MIVCFTPFYIVEVTQFVDKFKLFVERRKMARLRDFNFLYKEENIKLDKQFRKSNF
jgi:hypothetical protein